MKNNDPYIVADALMQMRNELLSYEVQGVSWTEQEMREMNEHIIHLSQKVCHVVEQLQSFYRNVEVKYNPSIIIIKAFLEILNKFFPIREPIISWTAQDVRDINERLLKLAQMVRRFAENLRQIQQNIKMRNDILNHVANDNDTGKIVVFPCPTQTHKSDEIA